MTADQAPVLTARAPAEATAAPRAGAAAWVSRYARPLALFAISRLVVLVAALPAAFRSDPGVGPWPDLPGGSALARVFLQWDGAWYVWIADRGYPTASQFQHHLSDVAFFPLFPAIVRGLAAVTHLPLVDAAIVVAMVASAITALLLWELTARLVGERHANRAVALFVFFPGAFVLSMAYAEPLMLAATAACLLLLLDRRWVLAGFAGAVATATRPNGVAIVVACLVVALVAVLRRREWSALAAPALSLCGIGSFFVYLWIRTGHATAWFQSERMMWHDHISIGAPIVRRIAGAITSPPTSLDSGRLNDFIADVGIVFVVLALVWVWRAGWPLAVRAYTVAALVIPSISNAVGPRPRMLLAAFPLAALGAVHLRPRAYNAVLFGSIVLLVGLTYVTTTSLAAVP